VDGGVAIGRFSARTGVSAETLRAWERRYGLLSPARTDGGRRLYSTADEAVVRAMKDGMARGMPAAEAARVALQGPSVAQTFLLPDLRVELEAALTSYSDARAQVILDRLFGGFSVETAVAEVVLPLLRSIGERWQTAEIEVGQEHFATAVLVGRLQALGRNWDEGDGPRALLACPPGELHTCGLLCFGLLIRGRGWRVTYLGADCPVSSIASAAAELQPQLVVLAALQPLPFLDTDLGALSRWPLWLAGAGAYPGLAERIGATYVGEGPLEAARKTATTAPVSASTS
jgi:DNA-binding transcriptional MerR regulator